MDSDLISDIKRFIFVHINRTAGTSVDKSLQPVARGFSHEHEHIVDLLAKRHNDIKYFSFAIVRNPWERAMSSYLFNVKREHKTVAGKTFKEHFRAFSTDRDSRHLPHLYYNSCFNWISDENDNILVDYIIRFEALDAGWRYVAKKLGLSVQWILSVHDVRYHQSFLACQKDNWFILPHRNRSGLQEDWIGLYDDESAEMVRQHYAKDIEVFGYSF